MSMKTAIPTGLYHREGANLEPIRPWRFGCWTDDGHHVDCDRGASGKRHHLCAYHREWMRIAGDNCIVAWVARGKGRNARRFVAFVWSPRNETHVLVHPRGRTSYARCGDAKNAADSKLVQLNSRSST